MEHQEILIEVKKKDENIVGMREYSSFNNHFCLKSLQ